MSTPLKILEQGIRAAGADGLCNAGLECGCELGDLAPCGDIDLVECKLGKKSEPTAEERERWWGLRDGDWIMREMP